jgi:site-specific DNA recombinase
MKTYGLVRVSTLSQKDNTSLDFQTKRIKDYCGVYDLELQGIISETESGGKDLNDRTGLSKLKELIKSNECKTIVVTKVDRLGRSLLQGLLFLKECEDNGVRVICIENGLDSNNPQNSLITNILFSIAENEKSTILNRLNDGKSKRFQDHKKPYGALSFGYRKNRSGSIVVDKNESEIVQYIYKRWNSLTKMSHLTKTKKTQRLLHSLKVRGHQFRGKDFQWWNVKKILSNPFYCGVLNWKNQSTNHIYDTIISKRMFNQINNT